MLTRKQNELLQFIEARLDRDGVAPSFDEMRTAINLKSKSGIHRLITALEERGFIRRLPNRARALEVCRPNMQKPAAKMAGKFVDALSAMIDVPVLGRIAAGTPIEALQQDGRSIPVPPDMVRTGEHYALEVSGDSMMNAGILDGDTVIIQRCDTAENGAIVVARIVEDNEATLKRMFRRGSTIALEPANPAYETRLFGPDLVEVQGRLVGLMRQY